MTKNTNPKGGYRPRVIVKLHQHVPPVEGRMLKAESLALPPQVAERWGALEMRPLFAGKRESLEELTARAVKQDPTLRSAAHAYWVVNVPPGVDPQELARALGDATNVESAYVEGGPTPPPLVDASDDPRAAQQGYLGAAPDGIDARFVWPVSGGGGFAGGDGTGIQFIDLEQGWTLNHEDLTAAGITLLSGLNNAYPGHGTSVLGEVRAVDNNIGCIGIAPAVNARVVSQWRDASTYSTAEAIMDAIGALSFGDVLLLEAQTTGFGGSLAPVEVEDAVYDAIRLATALGIIVVEAGANGGLNLDTYTDASGKQILNRASVDFRDSGAIIVGAATSTSPHSRLGFSSFGSRVDCFAWGQNINTTGDGWMGTLTNSYTTGFGGTSGASPMVTGAAIVVQGMAEASLGRRFSPFQMRQILSDPAQNTHSMTPATDLIGVMPNLHNIVQNVLGIVPDIYVRDHVGDDGTPHTGAISSSPDIIVRPAPVIANPQAAFGQGSGTENSETLGFEVEDNFDNYVYVRMLNRGGAPATNVTATVYWSPPATLVSPNLWTLIGTTNLASLPTGNVLTVADPLLWPAATVPPTGHYCFVGLIGTANDPAPGPASFIDWSNFERFIRDNNNVTWRNFNVVNNIPPAAGPTPPGFVPLQFLIAGAADRARHMKIDVDVRLPNEAQVLLDLPHTIAEPFHRNLIFASRATAKVGKDRVLATLRPHGIQRIGEMPLPAKMAAPAQILVKIPEKLRGNEYDVIVRQTYEGREVGRITWRLSPRVQERPKKKVKRGRR